MGWFLLGAICGAAVGVVMMALAVSAARADEERDRAMAERAERASRAQMGCV